MESHKCITVALSDRCFVWWLMDACVPLLGIAGLYQRDC